MILNLYRFLSIIALPFIMIHMAYRVLIGKEERSRVKEKFWLPTQKRPKGEIIWIHAASVGEMLSCLFLIKERPDKQFLLTTCTVTSAKMFKKQNLKNCIHQFAPIDSLICIKEFLKYWKPNKAFFIESEIWPNMILETSRVCEIVLLNANISDKSYDVWCKIPNTSKFLFSVYKYIFPISKEHFVKFSKFSPNVVNHFVNLKYYAEKLKYSDDANVNAENLIVCVSTHEGEEEIILNAIKDIENISIVIIPRHIKRAEEIEKKASEIGLKSSIRSKSNKQEGVYIVDTMGEVGTFLNLNSIVIMGGTFTPIGGHNFLEAIRFGCPVIIGPYHDTCQDLVEDFEGAVTICKNELDLKDSVLMLMKNKDIYAQKGLDIIDSKVNKNLLEVLGL